MIEVEVGCAQNEAWVLSCCVLADDDVFTSIMAAARNQASSKAYQSKLGRFGGGPECMRACGFRIQSLPTALGEEDEYLVMDGVDLDKADSADAAALKSVVEIFDSAITRLESASATRTSSSPAAAPAPFGAAAPFSAAPPGSFPRQ